jgi:hypothetical protein
VVKHQQADFILLRVYSGSPNVSAKRYPVRRGMETFRPTSGTYTLQP